jgi:hypothetical protein
MGLERGPLSLVRINEELLERKSSGYGLENQFGACGSVDGAGAMLQAGRARVRVPLRSLIVFNFLILPAASRSL